MALCQPSLNTVKVVRLKHDDTGLYLTANEDEESVSLRKQPSKNAEWRVSWLQEPEILSGNARFWSIYDKVLSAEGSLLDDTVSVTQEAWPVSRGRADWKLAFKFFRKVYYVMLVKRNSWGLNKFLSVDNNLEFEYFPYFDMLKWFLEWELEVVESTGLGATAPDSNRATFSNCQIGQMFSNSSPPASSSGHGGTAVAAAQSYNSAGNVNYSGTQNNRDVIVSNDIIRSQDFSINFSSPYRMKK